MARMRWFKYGLVFSIIIFLALYFFIYTKITSANGTPVLKLGSLDISSLAGFFSSLKNIIISSLIVGFLLGLLAGGGRRNRYNQPQNY